MNCKRSNFISRSYSQIPFFAADVKAIYLALVNKKTSVGGFFEYQLIGPPLNMKIKPKVDF